MSRRKTPGLIPILTPYRAWPSAPEIASADTAASPEVSQFLMVMPIVKGVVPILTILITLVLGLLIALRPVCDPMNAADVAEFEEVSRPIEERRETNFYGLRTFQQRDGQCHYCKSAIEFWFFF